MNKRILWVGMIIFLLGACRAGSTVESPTGGELVINEVMPVGNEGDSAWVEIRNTSEQALALEQGMLNDGSGKLYTFPDELTRIPPGAFLVVVFDGVGSDANEYDFGDGKAVLHSPPDVTDPFDAEGDQLALFGATEDDEQTMLDFLAWGVPAGEEDDRAVDAGLWRDEIYVNAERGGIITGSSRPGDSVGLVPDQPPDQMDSWVVYGQRGATQGEDNTLPTTGVTIPSDGALLLSQDFRLTWYNVPFAAEYRLQMDNNQDFSSPEVDKVLAVPYFSPDNPPDAGIYYWRTRAVDDQGQEGPYSRARKVTIASAAPLTLPEEPVEENNPFVALGSSGGVYGLLAPDPSTATRSSIQAGAWETDYLNNLPPILQRKDSDMICWDGDAEQGQRRPWDGPHQDTPGNHSRHGRQYCARASIAMINHQYGGNLSQDRITYHHFGGDGWPVGDLGHDKPLLVKDISLLLSWALDGAFITEDSRKPSFVEIQKWTREEKPIMATVPGHAIVLRGWAVFKGENNAIPAGTRFVIYNDPWDARMHVERYSSIPITNTWEQGDTPSGRQQEDSVSRDLDGDGIVSFDETERFRLDPRNPDTDNDCVLDKLDMHSFLYNASHNFDPGYADHDGDGLWKQEDEDNDNGGVIDGNEDADLNGHSDANETDNFDATDDLVLGNCRVVPSATSTSAVAASTSTPTTSPTSTPTPVPTQDNAVRREDEEDDAITCSSQNAISDPKVDITEVETVREDGKTLVVRIHLEQSPQEPKTSEYSYAAVVSVNPGQQALRFFWEIHSGQEDQEGNFAWVEHPLPDGDSGLVPEFRLPLDELPENINRLQVEMFHMGSSDSECATDQLMIETP